MHVRLESAPQVEHPLNHVVAVSGDAQLPLDGVHHLLRRGDAGRGDEHEEGDLVGARCRDRTDPAALADPPEPHALGVDGPQDGDSIVRLQVEAAARRITGGLTLSAPVEGDDADPRRRQQLVEVPSPAPCNATTAFSPAGE